MEEAYFYAGYVAIALFVIMLVAVEVGFRLGQRRTTLSDRTFSVLGVIQGSLIGTVALLLGFSFAMASERYDTRRILLAQEVNAAATTYLRTTVVSDENGREMRRLIRDYLAQRLRWFEAKGDRDQIEAASKRVAELQIDIWRHAQAEARKDPQSEMNALLVEAVNELIEIEGMQRAARRARVPSSVIVLVSIAAIATALTLGYGFGVTTQRVLTGTIGFCAMVAAILFTIVDFDRPDRGFVRISNVMLEAMYERIVRAVDREQRER